MKPVLASLAFALGYYEVLCYRNAMLSGERVQRLKQTGAWGSPLTITRGMGSNSWAERLPLSPLANSGPLIMRFSVGACSSWMFRPIPRALAALLHHIAARFPFGAGATKAVASHPALGKPHIIDRGKLGAAEGLTKKQAEDTLDWLENHGQRGVLDYDIQAGYRVRRE